MKKELRIGNFIQNNSIELEVCQIFGDSFQGMFVGGKGCFTYDSSEGILLTEEWLLKFGFHEKYKSSGNRWYLRATQLNIGCEIYDPEDEETGMLTHNFYYRNSDGAIDIKYVHQLQNLYYALTEQELIINQK